MAGPGFYAVRNGRSTGIYHSWSECERNVKGFSKAEFKKFSTAEAANSYMNTSSSGMLFIQTSINSTASTSSDSSSHYLDYGPSRSYSSYSNSSSNASAGRSKSIYSNMYNANNAPSNLTESPCVVYTDGSCLANGRSQARGGYGVHFPHDPSRDISASLSSSGAGGRQSNQRAELQAVRSALDCSRDIDGPLEVRTDSRYVVKGLTQWGRKWEKQPEKPVVNRDLFDSIARIASERDDPVVLVCFVL